MVLFEIVFNLAKITSKLCKKEDLNTIGFGGGAWRVEGADNT